MHAAQPMYLSKAPSHRPHYFIGRHFSQIPDEDVRKPEPPRKTFSLTYALVNGTWSLASLDQGVKQGFLVTFKKAGITYFRLT